MPVQKAAHSSGEIVFRHFENVVKNWRRDWIRALSCSRSQILTVSNKSGCQIGSCKRWCQEQIQHDCNSFQVTFLGWGNLSKKTSFEVSLVIKGAEIISLESLKDENSRFWYQSPGYSGRNTNIRYSNSYAFRLGFCMQKWRKQKIKRKRKHWTKIFVSQLKPLTVCLWNLSYAQVWWISQFIK